VEDGTPFCKNCGAPQIRVPKTDTDPASVVTSGPELIPEAEVVRETAVPVQPGKISWSQALPITAFAGLLEAFFSFFGVGMLVGGFLAVALYLRRRAGGRMTAGMGARLGLASGGLGFLIFAIFRGAGILIFHTGPRLRAEMLQALEQAAARNPDPQAQAVFQYFKTPDGLTVMLTLALIFTLLAFLLLSTLGGVLGAVSLRKRQGQ
jgi:hypothetical protein